VTLTANSTLSGLQCGGPVRITCRAGKLVTVFWGINDWPEPIASYTKPLNKPTLPVNMTTTASLSIGGIVFLTELVPHDGTLNNYTTILDSTKENLVQAQVGTIWCGYNTLTASLTVTLTIRCTEIKVWSI